MGGIDKSGWTRRSRCAAAIKPKASELAKQVMLNEFARASWKYVGENRDLNMTAVTKRCSECGKEKMRSFYRETQWNQSACRRCAECMRVKNPRTLVARRNWRESMKAVMTS